MANGTAAALVDQGRLSIAEAAVWADALAMLVDDGQEDGPVVLLSRVVDRVTAERVRRALVGRLGPVEDRLAAQVEAVFRTAVAVPAAELPSWSETGRPASVRQALSIWTRPSWRTAWRGRPITVMAFQVTGAPAGVLLELGPGGLPHQMLSHQARRVGGAMVSAADLADRVNGSYLGPCSP